MFYNNTLIFGPGGQGIYYPAGGSTVSPQAMFTNYNNIYSISSGTPNYEGILALVAGSIALSDYNLYGSIAASGQYLTLAPTSNPGAPSNAYTLSSWQNALGFDTHSAALNPSFVNPTSLNPPGYALTTGTAGSASGSNPGRVGGVSGGAPCDMGAWGGASAPTQIGCNFGPAPVVPNPPVIISVS
jgi:hypothetical protein